MTAALERCRSSGNPGGALQLRPAPCGGKVAVFSGQQEGAGKP